MLHKYAPSMQIRLEILRPHRGNKVTKCLMGKISKAG